MSLKSRLKLLEQSNLDDGTVGVICVVPGLTAWETEDLVFIPGGPRRPGRLIAVINDPDIQVNWTAEDTEKLKAGNAEARSRIYWQVKE